MSAPKTMNDPLHCTSFRDGCVQPECSCDCLLCSATRSAERARPEPSTDTAAPLGKDQKPRQKAS